MVKTTIATSRRYIARTVDLVCRREAQRQRSIATLLPIFLCACGATNPPDAPIALRFEVRFDGDVIGCGTGDGFALTDLRFYVHDVTLTAGSQQMAAQLDDETLWQDGTVALIDLEDGSGACRNGSTEVNDTIHASVPRSMDAAEYELAFSIGIPESLNHANPLLAPPPRNLSSMHWHWRSGYKFMRVGVETDTDLSWMHLGSARCSGTINNIEGCRSANRPQVRITDFDPRRDRVVLDVARLLGPTRLGDDDAWSCESGPAERQCSVAFAELGLDFAGGESIGPAPAFYARRER